MQHQLKTSANPFQFSELDIRTTTDEHGEVWFCAKDVCAALDIVWSGASITLENMPDNWFMVMNLMTIKGERDAIFINEAGLYHLIFRSNKPKAKEFANWVCETVLPEILRTGFFGTIDIKEQISISKQVVSISLQIVNTTNAHRGRILQDQLRRLCNIINQPIPPDYCSGQGNTLIFVWWSAKVAGVLFNEIQYEPSHKVGQEVGQADIKKPIALKEQSVT